MIDFRTKITKKLNDFRKCAELTKLSIDVYDRDTAICYIDGEFIEGGTHANCLNEYLKQKVKDQLNEQYLRPAVFDDYYDQDDLNHLPSERKEDIEKVKNNIKEIVFAHEVISENDDGKTINLIYIEKNSLYNVDINEAIDLFENHYPDSEIYIEETNERVARDLRKSVVAFKIKPTSSKNKDFHLALSDYLYKELRYQGINVSKQDVLLKVTLSGKHQDKYEHVIIDCLEGKLFLRGKDVTDKYFGRLRRFQGGQRQSDAFFCATQSAKRILERIEKIEQELNNTEKEVFGSVNMIDLRGQKNIIRIDKRKHSKKDLRKTASKKIIDLRGQRNIIRIDKRKHAKKDLRKLAYHDSYNREYAVLYVNGKIYEADSHSRALQKYLDDNEISHTIDNSKYRTEYDDNIYLTNSSAICHYIKSDNAIFIEPDTLTNVDVDTVKAALLKKYPNVEIYLDDEDINDEGLDNFQRIADLRKQKIVKTDMRKRNRKDLRKLARRDIMDRDEMDGAIVYIDGEVLSDESHGKCISKYLESKVNKPLNHGYSRPIGFDPMFLNMGYEIEYGKKDKEDMENIMNNIKQMAFAHKNSENKTIYVEEPSLYNISLTDASNAIKAAYPDYDIYSDDTEEKVARKDFRSIKFAKNV